MKRRATGRGILLAALMTAAPPGVQAQTDTITCESVDGHERFYPIDVGRARVELTRQLSRGECRFARNWGYDRRGVWVNGGCRGEFTVHY